MSSRTRLKAIHIYSRSRDYPAYYSALCVSGLLAVFLTCFFAGRAYLSHRPTGRKALTQNAQHRCCACTRLHGQAYIAAEAPPQLDVIATQPAEVSAQRQPGFLRLAHAAWRLWSHLLSLLLAGVMEAIAGLSLAANILQVVDFTAKILSTGNQIRLSGSTVENSELDLVVRDLKALSECTTSWARPDPANLGPLAKDSQVRWAQIRAVSSAPCSDKYEET